MCLAGGFLANALFLQKEKHPAPYFNARQQAQVQSVQLKPAGGAMAPLSAVPTPQPRPSEFSRTRASSDPIGALASGEPARPVQRVRQDSVQARQTRAPESRAAETPAAPMQLASAPVGRASNFDAIGSLITTGKAVTPTPPASIPKVQADSVNRIFAIQQALAKLGYRVGVDGVAGNETRLAIEAFEASRKMPVTGQMSARLTRELAARSGVKIP